MKAKTLFGAAAAAVVTTQACSADLILLAGFNKFEDQSNGVLVQKAADEGLFSATSEMSYRGGSTSTGGSTDNFYGSEVGVGVMTNQLPFNTTTSGTNPTINGPYVFEDDPSGADRLVSTYSPIPQPSNVAPDGVTSSTANGRIRNMNGADLVVTNDSMETYFLRYLVFDSFVGDVSTNTNSTGTLEPFTVNLVRGGISVSTVGVLPSIGYAGHNSLSGEAVDTPLANPNSVNNLIDFGTGTNYLDYIVDLGGIEFAPGDRVEIGFNYTSSNGGILRGDNFAVLATIPEPSSALALGGLLGLGLLSSRRRK